MLDGAPNQLTPANGGCCDVWQRNADHILIGMFNFQVNGNNDSGMLGRPSRVGKKAGLTKDAWCITVGSCSWTATLVS